MSKDESGHAYPYAFIDPNGNYEPEYNEGLTKRERFAMAALQGLCSNATDIMSKYYLEHQTPEEYFETIAKESLLYADALLKEIEK